MVDGYGSARAEEPMRVAVVGMSNTPTCGARDHAGLLAGALQAKSISCTTHWLDRREPSLKGSRVEIARWAARLEGELEREQPDVLLLHYSTFAYSHRGVPLFLAPTLAALERSGFPLVTFMHEFVYPWRRGDVRGNVWGVTQRAALIRLVRSSRAILVTTDSRADWFASRRWLPRRRLAVAPVFSNLPQPSSQARPRTENLLGLFGYSYQGAAFSLVLDAVRLLLDRGVRVELRLLGAPGPASGAGRDWQQAADVRGVGELLSFTGTLSAQDLSDALAACEILLFVDPPGPTSRKGTLAGSLASGRPLIALDGPQSWKALTDAGAAHVVPPNPDALASAILELLEDRALRDSLGARGRAFAERAMGLVSGAEIVAATLRAAAGRGGSPNLDQAAWAGNGSPAPPLRADSQVDRASP